MSTFSEVEVHISFLEPGITMIQTRLSGHPPSPASSPRGNTLPPPTGDADSWRGSLLPFDGQALAVGRRLFLCGCVASVGWTFKQRVPIPVLIHIWILSSPGVM